MKQQNDRHDQIESLCRRQNRYFSSENFLFDRVENTVGKGENAGLPAFSPFPTVFSKAFL